MNHKEYIYTAALCIGKPYPFINFAIGIKRRYAILHFMLVLCLLFIPILTLVVRTQPDQLYTRMFSQSFEDAVVKHHNPEQFSPEIIAGDRPVIYVFDDFVIYADPNIILSVPSEFFTSGDLIRPFGEVFSMIAVYNMYIPHLLLPMLMIAFLILLVLQLLFYLMSATFLGIFRLASSRFVFGERIKIAIMSSLFPALISAAVGFFLPAVHIILFQMINLVILFSFSKRYDKREKELLLSEEERNVFQ